MTENNQPAVTDWHLFTGQIIVLVGHFHRLFLKVHNYVFDALKSGYKIFDHLVEFVFISPRVMNFAITAKNCFFLGHLFGFHVSRFDRHLPNSVLRFWKRYHQEKNERRNGNTGGEIAAIVCWTVRSAKNVLTGLRSYGPIISTSFSFSLFDLTFDLYYIIFFNNNYTTGIAINSQYSQYFQNLLFFNNIIWVHHGPTIRCNNITISSRSFY